MSIRNFTVFTLLALMPAQSWAQGGDAAIQLLLAKARALDARGRQDLAMRTWKQVLLTSPNNAEAIAAMARGSRPASGDTAAKSTPARQPAPRDPRLRTAESLSQSGNYEESVRTYQDVFGKRPPDGPLAVQYYETMAGSKGHTEEAVAGLERLMKSYPNAYEYRLALGRVLTYRPQTRAQGMRVLQQIPAGSTYGIRARAAWRQALVWDNGSGSSMPILREYLALYPDPELAGLLTSAVNAAPKPLTQSPEEALGYETLNAGKIDAAVIHFEKALREAPRSATAHAGMGYARMRQQSWADAARAWDQAVQLAPTMKQYAAARADARYFLALEEGTKALEQGKAAFAKQRFDAALAIRPASIDAQRGLAGALMATGDNKQAAGLFEKLVTQEPGTSDNWRNMIAARAQAGNRKEALTLWQKAPDDVQVALQRDVEFQLMLGGVFLDLGQPKEAAARYQAAAGAAPTNVVAWEGWIAALMAGKDEAKAYETLSSIPAEVYKEALERPEFLRSAALIQMHFGRLDVVESLLMKWIARAGNEKVPGEIQTQLANIWIKQGKPDQAEKLMRDLMAKDPNNTEAMRLLLLSLSKQNRAAEALVESKRFPPLVQAKLQQDADYMALIAGINNDAGNQGEALRLVRETLSRFSQKGEQAPGHLVLQQAWLLLNTGGDSRELFSALRVLSAHTDLTPSQHTSYMDLWSVWAQRQAEEARRGGNLDRATAILGEASKLLPSDARIRSAYAGYLTQAGETKRALAAYKIWGLTGATPTDYTAAIGTAMAEKSDLVKRWLEEGIKKFPNDPQILSLAGELAAQAGDYRRAEILYRSALALADVKPKPETAPLLANRGPGNTLGQLILGEQGSAGKEDTDTEQLGRVLSGEAGPETLLGKNAVFANSLIQPKSESDRISDKLRAITGRNTPYFDVSTSIHSRSGTPGFDRRTLQETEIGASKVLNNAVRVSMIVRPTTIRTEASDGGSETFRFGLLPTGSIFAASTVSGLGAEVQMSTENFGLRLGASPQGFLVKNYLGGLRFRPMGGHLTLQLTRDNVKDSVLSFAGQQDPITKQTWGGVMSNQGQITGNWGDEQSGFYVSGGYALITGQNVQTNRAFNGNGGNYWRVMQRAEGSLTFGLNLTGLAYEKNLRYYTLGQGGYFSPQRFYIFNVPVTWRGVYGPRFRYTVNAGLGTQHFREDGSPYFPTLPSLQNATRLYYPGQSQTGASYSVDFKGIYQLSEQWYVESFFNLNNARSYTAQSAGFTLKYGFTPRPIGGESGPASVPDWKGAQPFQP